MKKFGVLIFAFALIVGFVATNMFSFGKLNDGILSFPFKFNRSVRGSGTMATERRELSGFHGIEAGGAFTIEVVAQKDFAVEVEADDNLLPLVRTEVRRGILHVSSEKGLKTQNPIYIRIAAPDIDKLEISGAATADISNIQNAGLDLDSSGASKIRLSGQTSKLIVDVSGATKIDAEGLVSENATVEASGACTVNVYVTGTLRAEASGASKITYTGSPRDVSKKSSGASSITAR